MKFSLPAPTYPSRPKGISGLAVTEEWEEAMKQRDYPYGVTEALWNKADVIKAQEIAVKEALLANRIFLYSDVNR